jgi:DNA invertase Pin-like site-specific DNA recombinase
MKTPAFGYVRVSGLGQRKGHGPERQREIIEGFARKRYEVAAVYADAHTGTEEDRPQFVAMLEALMGNGVKTVIVESLDRLARDLMIQSTLLAKLAAEGVTLLAANTGEDVTAAMKGDPMRKAMIQLQGIFAELDKSLTVLKLRKARDAKRKTQGWCEGPRPFGLDPKRPEEANVVERIARHHKGKPRLSLSKIAADLNNLGFKTRMGRAWSKMTVKSVVDGL